MTFIEKSEGKNHFNKKYSSLLIKLNKFELSNQIIRARVGFDNYQFIIG